MNLPLEQEFLSVLLYVAKGVENVRPGKRNILSVDENKPHGLRVAAQNKGRNNALFFPY
jgi:hypothetical protein